MADNNKDDGGQAYPRSYAYSARTPALAELVSVKGMTLLDYFAGLVMQAEVSIHDPDATAHKPETYANAAYTMAEAMIAEKRKREES